MIDTGFGRIVDGILEYAEVPLKGDGKVIFNPSPEMFLARGFKKIVRNRLPEKDGFSVEQDGMEETETQIILSYKYVEEYPSRKTYRRSYIAQWLREYGVWNGFKALLSQSEDLEFMWETSTEFDSDHPMWEQALEGVRMALGIPENDIEDMLWYGEHGSHRRSGRRSGN